MRSAHFEVVFVKETLLRASFSGKSLEKQCMGRLPTPWLALERMVIRAEIFLVDGLQQRNCVNSQSAGARQAGEPYSLGSFKLSQSLSDAWFSSSRVSTHLQYRKPSEMDLSIPSIPEKTFFTSET